LWLKKYARNNVISFYSAIAFFDANPLTIFHLKAKYYKIYITLVKIIIQIFESYFLNKTNDLQQYTDFINKQLLEMLSVHYVLVDQAGILIDINPALKQLLEQHFHTPPLLGELKDLFPNLDQSSFLTQAKNQKMITMITEMKLEKQSCKCSLSAKPFVIDKKQYYLVSVQIINQQPEEKDMNKLLLQSIYAVTEVLESTEDIDNQLELLLQKLYDIYHYDLSCLMFLEGYDLKVKAAKTNFVDIELPLKINLINNKQVLNFIKTKNTIIINKDVENNPLTKLLNVGWAKEIVLVPLKIQDSFFGLLLLINENIHDYNDEFMTILEIFSTTTANTIKNNELNNLFRLQLEILRENVIERTKSLEFIKEQNERILEADKLKNEFIAQMSHELRTPLNAIIGFSEALKLKLFGDLTSKQEEYISDIHVSGIHLLGMINDILDLAKIESKKMAVEPAIIHIETSINEVINVIVVLAEQKNIMVKDIFQHSAETMYTDRRKMHQILFNLLSNAIKFSKENSTVEVLTHDKTIDDKPALEIVVKDHGMGIPQEHLEVIFNKFHQLDNVYNKTIPGTGLGLTITRELVLMQNGLIDIESVVDKGTIFKVTLPIKYEEQVDNQSMQTIQTK
jgi:signal transduction histidine kinase